MIKYFLAENMKMRHTFFNRVVFIGPVLCALMTAFLEYIWFGKSMYNSWYILIQPVVLVVVCNYIIRIDKKKKNKIILGLPLDLKKVWSAKTYVVVKNLILTYCVIYIISIIYYIFNASRLENLYPLQAFLACILLVITFMWQIPLINYLVYKFGLYAGLPFALVLNFVSQVQAVKSYWVFNPFSYPARVMCPVLKVLPNGLPAVKESITFTPEVLSYTCIPVAVIVSVILFFAFTYVTAKMFDKGEKNK